MTEPANYWKLGLFIVLGLGLSVAAMTVVGTLALGRETMAFRSYFEEPVTGLERGATVKYRGVTIGQVGAIEIAPDGRHVEVMFELTTSSVKRLNWASADDGDVQPAVPEGVRAQLASLGVSGVKYLQLDYFGTRRRPAAELPFPTPPGTIPSAPSTFASLEESLVRVAEDFPQIAERSLLLLEELHEMVAGMQTQRVSDQLVTTLSRADTTLATLDAKLSQLPVAGLSEEARRATAQLTTTLAGLEAVLEQLRGERGLIASLRRTSESIGVIAGPAGGAEYELGATLREFRILMETLQGFVETLERDPDMLLKGRAELP